MNKDKFLINNNKDLSLFELSELSYNLTFVLIKHLLLQIYFVIKQNDS